MTPPTIWCEPLKRALLTLSPIGSAGRMRLQKWVRKHGPSMPLAADPARRAWLAQKET